MATVIEQLNTLEEIAEAHQTGFLNGLMKAGIIPWQVLQHRDMYQRVDELTKTQGISKTRAANQAALDFNVSESTIFFALKKMGDEA